MDIEEKYLEYGNEGIDCKGKKWHRVPLGTWAKDNTSLHFNYLTALFRVEPENKKDRAARWLCLCDCGNLIIVPNRYLQSGATKSCGCNFYNVLHAKAEDLTGQRFGRITVLERDYNYQKEHNLKTTNVNWKCQCDCGKIFVTNSHSLKTGHTISCGCYHSEISHNLNFIDLTGKKINKLTVVRQSNRCNSSGDHYWYCNCDCGTKNIEIIGASLRQNLTYSCGCINSKGEEKIANILTENNINFKREYKPDDFILSSGGKPRYDFAILNADESLAYFIEYHGIQHYLFKPQGRYDQYEIDKIDQRDWEKKQYCEKKNIPLIEIPYYKFNTLNIDDLYFPELIH